MSNKQLQMLLNNKKGRSEERPFYEENSMYRSIYTSRMKKSFKGEAFLKNYNNFLQQCQEKGGVIWLDKEYLSN